VKKSASYFHVDEMQNNRCIADRLQDKFAVKRKLFSRPTCRCNVQINERGIKS